MYAIIFKNRAGAKRGIKTSRKQQTHRYREQTDSCRRGGGWGLGEKGEGIKQKKTTKLLDIDNSMVIIRGKGGVRVGGGRRG